MGEFGSGCSTKRASKVPQGALVAATSAALPLLPTYLWVASPSPLAARGRPLRVPPRPVRTGR